MIIRIQKVMVAALFATPLSCAKFEVQRRSAPLRPEAPLHVVEVTTLVWGLAPLPRTLVESEICPASQFETARFSMAAWDVAESILTLGFYVPFRVVFQCAEPTLHP